MKEPIDKKKSLASTQAKIERVMRTEFKKLLSKLNKQEVKLDRMIRKHDTKMHHFDKIKGVVEEQMRMYAMKMDSVEEAFFILYHNIKKNQFLYANDNESWWKDYLDLKKHYDNKAS